MEADESKAQRNKILQQAGKRRLCPMSASPHKDCYISRMDSQSIEAAMYYCGGHHEECAIFRKMDPAHLQGVTAPAKY